MKIHSTKLYLPWLYALWETEANLTQRLPSLKSFNISLNLDSPHKNKSTTSTKIGSTKWTFDKIKRTLS